MKLWLGLLAIAILIALHLGLGFAGAHAARWVTFTAQVDLIYGNKFYSYGWRSLGLCEVRLMQLLSYIQTPNAVVRAECVKEQDT